MKKVIGYFCCFLLIFSLVSCNKAKNSKSLVIHAGESTRFSSDEIYSAIDCVENNFSFPAATLTKLEYDEERFDDLVDGYLENGRGAVNGASKENVIIILSEFDVDGSGDNPVLNPNTTYTDYQWILIRENKTSPWKIDDWGY